ncbi:methyltransferase domain-containing protein [Streptomyces sp. NPDC006326]|uniref:methyltransferase domain-containing protein n=1 Tax=Streptomyces sp. NPDC006326 TaxID=3156752 RepID=UPI0033BCE1CE
MIGNVDAPALGHGEWSAGPDRVRAVLVTPSAGLLVIRRVKPGVAPYHVLPGGKVEPGDDGPEAALLREIREEIAGEATGLRHLHTHQENGERQDIYTASIAVWSWADRTGPEFTEPGRGEYHLEEVPLTAGHVADLNLKPEGVRAVILDALTSGRIPTRDTGSTQGYWDHYATGWGVIDWPDDTRWRGWTQYEGHGPGPEHLGTPGSILELGCGSAIELAYYARRGIPVTGVDLAPAHIDAARARCSGLPADFHNTDITSFLSGTERCWDVALSRFGAVWFSNPRHLLPLILARLNPGGLLAFSHAPAVPGCYGPQGMYPGALRGRPIEVRRWSYTPRKWTSLLLAAGFERVEAAVLPAPNPADLGTLMVRAWAPAS